MHILVVEDNAFSAFCLRRLLEATSRNITVSIVTNSLAALKIIVSDSPDCIVLDGYLGAYTNAGSNGPELANIIWKNHPHLPIIAWTDSEAMRLAFAVIFEKYEKSFHSDYFWTKAISLERISSTLQRINKTGLTIGETEAQYLKATG